jgi:hypothetical protein
MQQRCLHSDEARHCAGVRPCICGARHSRTAGSFGMRRPGGSSRNREHWGGSVLHVPGWSGGRGGVFRMDMHWECQKSSPPRSAALGRTPAPPRNSSQISVLMCQSVHPPVTLDRVTSVGKTHARCPPESTTMKGPPVHGCDSQSQAGG